MNYQLKCKLHYKPHLMDLPLFESTQNGILQTYKDAIDFSYQLLTQHLNNNIPLTHKFYSKLIKHISQHKLLF